MRTSGLFLTISSSRNPSICKFFISIFLFGQVLPGREIRSELRVEFLLCDLCDLCPLVLESSFPDP